ncbi:alpha/beta-hydrolase [Fomitiporia mediterranea MF3/22]|uniref:alpha/beta-hydrolase n=1 Tax=Fomitiporia mediterranea (strain MF3/22) TaxID=694068 RepID=UPI0004408EE7|nr:alpha/beta-hydrolase [Fomitiporia mediterranea MF3/22]EJD01733.1 alpha/beta-hydrolase [Fomitiporia mediterranea MF3/22]
MAHHSSTYLSLSMIAVPALLVVLRLLASFPLPPEPVAVYPSLASLPKDSHSWLIYPENFYEGGNYVNFPFGRVRYWLLGPEEGQKIVLIHGLSVPSIIWKDVAPTLAAKGFRILIYDLYGRGYSDAPYLPYSAGLYTTQLALLMQHVRWERAHIVGLSMGGGIASSFAANFPNLTTSKIALIAATGLMESSDLSRTSRVMSSPPVQYVASTSVVRFLLQRLGAGEPSSNPIHEIVQIQSAYLPGYNYAIASSLRDGPLRGLRSSFSTLTDLKKDLLLIWGTSDNTVPYRYTAMIQELVPNSKLLTVEGGHHDLTLSHPKLVTEALVDFFRSKK